MYSVIEESRDRQIEKNMGLVHSCAHKFKGRGIEYDDLFQAGCMGLIKAVDAFDTERGVRFSTYAVPVILGEMRRLFRDGGTVKVSRTLKELSLKTTRERERFIKKNFREPTVSELANILDADPEMITEAIGAGKPTLSLTYDDDGCQIDVPTASPEDMLSDKISIEQVLDKLPQVDSKLIELRFFKYKTQTQTAQILGMTQVQVSRKEKKILLKMRELLK